MVISDKKPIQEILGFLEGSEKVVLVGCNQCAATCKTGGEPELQAMKEELEANGKTVLGCKVIEPCCKLKGLVNLKKPVKHVENVNLDGLVEYAQ